MITTKRIYDLYDKKDGYRVLVDRLWPRGVTKEKAHLNLWLKEIAPSTGLRKWFSHDTNKWNEFEKRYKQELQDKKELIRQIQNLEQKHKRITLLYGARDAEHNEALVLCHMLQLVKKTPD